MIPNGQRTPLATFTLPVQPQPMMPGSSMRIPIPIGPSNAMYAMITMNLMDSFGAQATADFVLVPLDSALRPNVHGADLDGGNLNLRWFSIPDRTYRVQFASDLRSSVFYVAPDLNGDGEELSAPFPIGSGQGYYRVALQPE